MTWIGETDLLNHDKTDNNAFPIDTLLGSGKFGQLRGLYTNNNTERVKDFIHSVQKKHSIPVEVINAGDIDPTDHQQVLRATLKAAEPFRQAGMLDTLVLNATSGTPTMGSVMFFLGVNNDIAVYTTKDPKKAGKGALYQMQNQPFREALKETFGWKYVKSEEFPFLSTDDNRVISSSLFILLQGESGAGKSHLAEYIHKQSRPSGKCRHLSCAEFANDINTATSTLFGHKKGAFTGADTARVGEFRHADNGTLFLDEVGELSPQMQAFLLKALQPMENKEMGAYGLFFTPLGEQERLFSRVRIVSATNKSLIKEVQAGRFRADLYYRLAQYTILIPPFRKMPPKAKQDMLDSVLHNVEEEQSQKCELTQGAYALLLEHDWPGNIRQLHFILKLLIVLSLGRTIDAEMVQRVLCMETPETEIHSSRLAGFSQIGEPGFSIGGCVDKFRKDYVLQALKMVKTKAEAAILLGINVQTLNNYLKK